MRQTGSKRQGEEYFTDPQGQKAPPPLQHVRIPQKQKPRGPHLPSAYLWSAVQS